MTTVPTTTSGNASSTTSDVQQKTQSAFMTLNLITQACHGIVNTTFIAPPNKPSWFDDLNSKLVTVQANATSWIDNTAPRLTGGVPAQVINYSSTYAAMTATIQNIASQYPDAQGASDPHVQRVLQLVAVLKSTVDDIITAADGMSTSLKSWGDQMQSSHDALSSGAADIQSVETDLQGDINAMNAAISSLNDAITAENKAIAASVAAIGTGIVLAVVSVALAPETGGASLLVAGTGALLVIGGAVTWGIMQHKINEQYAEIAQDQSELNADDAQMVALQGLATSSSQAIDYIDTCTSALSDFRTSWTVFQDELQAVSDNLGKAEQSLSVIVESAFSQVAANDWAAAGNFAQSLANAPVNLAAAQMNMNGQITSAA